MRFKEMASKVSQWLEESKEIVISSRVRLARNLADLPFTHWAKKKELSKVVEEVLKVTQGSSYLKNALIINLKELDDIDCQFLMERHLISREHALGIEKERAVIIGDKEIISIMVNEEDHLRIQVTESGLNLFEAWRLATKIDNELEKRLNYAFSEKYGYLTACPTNTGTGLRASVMIHLPALVISRQINKVLDAVSRANMAVRGIYGEGTQAQGDLFQVSNEISLGENEEEIVGHVEKAAQEIMEYEKGARKRLLTQLKEEIKNSVSRAYGTLCSAYTISSIETLTLLSKLRLGVSIGLAKDIDVPTLNELLILTRPAHLQEMAGRKLSAPERDVKRAAFIRSKLGIRSSE
ncbi:protein arginine kinase [bacterium]|nr:protein arginine kinase [bacterium]